MSESKTVQIRDMDPDLWRKVKSKAADLGVSIKDYVADVLAKAVSL
jgi:plasmid stability protein